MRRQNERDDKEMLHGGGGDSSWGGVLGLLLVAREGSSAIERLFAPAAPHMKPRLGHVHRPQRLAQNEHVYCAL